MKNFVPVVLDGVDNPYDALVGILVVDTEDKDELDALLVSIEEEFVWRDNDWDSFEEYVMDVHEGASLISPSLFLTIQGDYTHEV